MMKIPNYEMDIFFNRSKELAKKNLLKRQKELYDEEKNLLVDFMKYLIDLQAREKEPISIIIFNKKFDESYYLN